MNILIRWVRILFITLIINNVTLSTSSKILVIAPVGTRSHHMFYKGIIGALSSRGHKLTVLTPYKLYQDVKNVEQIETKSGSAALIANSMFNKSTIDLVKTVIIQMPEMCINTTEEKGVSSALEKEYDFILIPYLMSRCYLPYVHNKKVPFALMYPNTVHSSLIAVSGSIDMPSIVPPLIYYMKHPMSFFQRTMSAMYSLHEVYFDRYISSGWLEKMLLEKGIFGYSSNSPGIYDIEKQASLTIINNVRALENPARLHSPNIIHAGGIHIQPTYSISKDLQKWLDESGSHGAILFSLGSVVKPSHIKEEDLKTIINVFKSLNQRIIFKWDKEELEDIPQNVKISKWVPQQDVLAHPNLKLFISHGGLLSTLEALYFGVPIIGMPVYGDQHHNIDKVYAEGCALRLNWNELSEETMKNAIQEGISNAGIRETVYHKSRLMRDAPQTPSESVIYWIEHVIRHKGGAHLRPPLSDIPWYKIYNVDVWLFFLTTIVFINALLIASCCYCCRKLRKSDKKKKE